MRVGYIHQGYPEKRLIINPRTKGSFSLKRIVDVFKVLDFITYKIFNTTNPIWHNLVYTLFNSSSIDVLHLFNGVWLNANKPWITTFETVVPRIGNKASWLERKSIKSMANKQCKALIAMSVCSAELQKKYIENNFPAFKQILLPKIIQLYPPQKINNDVDFNNSERLHFLFVGVDFYRKGGLPVLKAFTKWCKQKPHVQLTIISKLEAGFISDYSEEYHDWVLQILKTNQQIKHMWTAPNEDVLKHCQVADVILLPSYADTFGYSILEGMANGCVPVVTNVRALPEMVNDERGFCINLNLDNEYNLCRKTSMYEHSQQITKQLLPCFDQIELEWKNKTLAARKLKCHNWVKENCDVSHYANHLSDLIKGCDKSYWSK